MSHLHLAQNEKEITFLPAMANRHGLIAGATGTGKTVTLMKMAESFSAIGVPVFLADIKGDIAGVCQTGQLNPKIDERLKLLGIQNFSFQSNPVAFWDVFGEEGHPLRTTISEMGPLLLSQLLNLNETQSGVLSIIFRLADDQGLLLLDLKDLRAVIQHAGENAADIRTQYGNISPASLGAIQRNLLALEEQGAKFFFGEPALDLEDFIQTDSKGRGVINVLSASRLMQSPKVYSTMLLWLLSELFERLPEAGDLEKPKLVFFFDEAHLLFNDAPASLLEKVEQVVRLIRSKGVGIYFVTQNPMDVPAKVLGQLGNRVQHALRAFTPQDQKAVKAAAQTFSINPQLDVVSEITRLGVGEALVSFLDSQGRPMPVEKAWVIPPGCRIGLIQADERRAVIQSSVVFGVYEKAVDRESAYEKLAAKCQANANAQNDAAAAAVKMKNRPAQTERVPAETYRVPPAQPKRGPGRPADNLTSVIVKSVARSASSQLGRSIVRGILGGILGGRR